MQQDFQSHEFKGHHLIASYIDCSSDAFMDANGLVKVMEEAVLASGATLMDTVKNIFPGGGLTIVMLLAESHASIHTYPEHKACFVDIFTCGNACVPENFDRILRGFLKPRKVSSRIIVRDANIEPVVGAGQAQFSMVAT